MPKCEYLKMLQSFTFARIPSQSAAANLVWCTQKRLFFVFSQVLVTKPITKLSQKLKTAHVRCKS